MKTILYITMAGGKNILSRLTKEVNFIPHEGLTINLKESILTVGKVLYSERDNTYLARVINDFDTACFTENYKILLEHGWKDMEIMDDNENLLFTLKNL